MMNRFPDNFENRDGIWFPVQNHRVQFDYSDGEEFERRIADIIMSAEDRSLFSPHISGAAWDWRSSCHLSPVRANLLRPIEAFCRKRVLELGAGCGPITRYLGELGGDVFALEASPIRAGIVRARTADLSNVHVVCDRIENFEASEQFDVVTMIGVLQYGRLFSSCGARAEVQLLETAARQLAPDGILVVGLQNKIGLKYLAGWPEANVGIPYFGLEDLYTGKTAIRFGLRELEDLLSSVGLPHHAVLYPMPDYHMPDVILSSRGLRSHDRFDAGALLAMSVSADAHRPDWRPPAFSLERAWRTVHRNGLAEDLANAFLFVASKTAHAVAPLALGKELAWRYSSHRDSAFATETRFTDLDDHIVVTRARLVPAANTDGPIRQTLTDENYLMGQLWWSGIVDIVNRPQWTVQSIADWATPWIHEVKKRAGFAPDDEISADRPVSGTLFDSTPRNLILCHDGKFQFFDQEWRIEHDVPFGFVIFRGLFGSLFNIITCAVPSPDTPISGVTLISHILELHGLPLTDNDVRTYAEIELGLQAHICKQLHKADPGTWLQDMKAFTLKPRKTVGDYETDLMQLTAKLQFAQAELLEKTNPPEDRTSELAELRRIQGFRLVRAAAQAATFALRVRTRCRTEILDRISLPISLLRRWRRMRPPDSGAAAESDIATSLPQIFTEIFERNGWCGQESCSGQGSDMSQTEVIRRALPDVIRRFDIETMLDIPCGDFNWMKAVDLDVQYTGGDIVPTIIEENNRKYSSPTRHFRVIDVCRDDVPAADLVFCRDLLVHLSFDDAILALVNLQRSGSKYLLTTTFPGRQRNDNITTGQWRPLNLQLTPFNLPEPLLIINEGCTEWEGAWADKSLGLWRLTEIQTRLQDASRAERI